MIGMSVGDSLLDYFSRTKIKEFINQDSSYSYANGDYVIIGLSKSNQNSVDLNTYQNLGITIKKSDRQYEIRINLAKRQERVEKVTDTFLLR